MSDAKLTLPRDADLLAFIFARFIDGELTGILEGHALTHAPSLDAADFLARQIRDEIKHAHMYRALYKHVKPNHEVPPAPRLLKAILAPLSGRHWYEHCFLDKALGERWVMHLMQRLIRNSSDRRIVRTLQAIARDEATHIEFGEQQTQDYIAQSRFRRYYLWGLFLRVDFAMALAYRLMRSLIARRFPGPGAALLEDFFLNAREQIAIEISQLLGTRLHRSWLQMVVCQAIFLARWPFAGWLRSPKF